MEESLFSPQWYRIAELHPQLRSHVEVRRQVTRGRQWYVLRNQANGRFHRVNEKAYELIGRLDGKRSVEQIWQTLIGLHGDEAPTQGDVVRVLGQLTEADLLQADALPDIRQLAATMEKRNKAEKRSRMNPLSFRVALFDPAALLDKLYPLARVLFNPWAAMAWLVLMVMGGLAVGEHFSEMTAHARQNLSQPHMLMLMWVCYPLLKAVHELGHGLALRRYHCESHEVGASFLLLMPIPYVDATSSYRLTNRMQRGAIVGAGVAVELGAAALAAMVWAAVQPGTVRDVALVLMTLGGMSSLLFNGNPLMRYDGYYLMCDLLDLPNLAVRSGNYWNEAISQTLLKGLGARTTPRGISGDWVERTALVLYAPASWLYRLVITVFIITWAAEVSAWLGAAVLLWSAWSVILAPLWRWTEMVGNAPQLEPVRLRARLLLMTVVLGLTMAVGWLPLPVSLLTEGVTRLPEQSYLRAASAGQVLQVLVPDGQWVKKGEPLVRMREPALDAQRAIHLARIDGDIAERDANWITDVVKVRNAEAALKRDRAALDEVDEQIAKLTVRAPDNGRFVLPDAQDVVEREVAQGALLGYVLPQGQLQVRAVVSERDVGLWRTALKSPDSRVSVMLADQPGQIWPGRVLREVPAGSDRLPDASLGEREGGPVPTDPSDKDGLKTLEPVFVFDIVVSDVQTVRGGGRAEVRLQMPAQSLAQRAYFRMRQLLLRHFADLQ